VIVNKWSDGAPVIRMADWSFAYVFTCFAGSSAPEIALHYGEAGISSCPTEWHSLPQRRSC